jgi:hypothetical protein
MLRIIHDSCARLRAATLAAAVLATAACGGGDKSTGPRGQDISGTYTLQWVANSGLPAVIQDGPWYDQRSGHYYDNVKVVVTEGSVQLTADGGCDMQIIFDITNDGQEQQVTGSGTGTYSLSGDHIVCNSDNNQSTLEGTVQNGVLALQISVYGTNDLVEFDFARN